MKTVFPNAMVAHIWAQGRQESGRSGHGNVFFEGPRLFSYGHHFLTAYRLPDGAAFLNAGKYSVSTSRHQSQAWRAIRGSGIHMPGALMGNGRSQGFPLPDFMDSRIFGLNVWTWPDGFQSDSPYGHEGRLRSEARNEKRPATEAEMKAARPALLKLFLDCPETAPAESIVAAFRYAGASPEEAAKAAAKVAAFHVKQAKDEAAALAKEQAKQRASFARAQAATPLEVFRGFVDYARAYIAQNNGRGAAERQAADLLATAKALLKAGKEARARGWNQIAADLKAREKLLRQGAAGLESFADRSQARANWGLYREAVQGGAKALKAGVAGLPPFWKAARQGAESLRNACQNGLKGQAYMKARAALAGADLARMVEGLEALALAFAEREEAGLREERAAALAKAAAALATWREGEGALPGRLSDLTGGALLRARGVQRDEAGAITGGALETSWGASVPLPHAIRAFRFLKLCRDQGTAWDANGKTLTVGHFRIDRVESTGDFKAGCHRINWPEVAALAARLGLSDLAPADTREERAHA